MTKFQIILFGVFGFFVVVGVLIFSMYRSSSEDVPEITMWGSIDENQFNDILASTPLSEGETVKIKYKQVALDTFDSVFVEALASGNGPDLFMLPSDKIVKHRNKILILPYTVFSERQFKDAFIEGSEIFTTPSGTYALPIVVDPLVMYWNRSLFNEAKVVQPPKYWDEFFGLANLISKKDGSLNIEKSAVAFGEYSNVSHAKDILSMLVMQAGNPITLWRNGQVASVFIENFGKPIVPAEAAVGYYVEFSNPAKNAYSWNRSLPSSYNEFLVGDLAVYFGYASEIGGIQQKNPNLNFDVAPVPSSREAGEQTSSGTFYGLAITKASRNPNAAFSAASIFSGTAAAKKWSEIVRLPPVRRDLLAQKQTSAYVSVFYDGAIRARTWLDPDPEQSATIFKNMIESITSGRSRLSEAVALAHRELFTLLKR